MVTKKATFGAGCFWGVESAFRRLPGVIDVRVGYTGGATANPTYEQVCADATAHAEAVEVTFDPAAVSFEELLDAFWAMHNPTTLNRQGPDVGTQYRSAVFVHDDEQHKAAVTSRDREQERLGRTVVTQIAPAAEFWPAEEYHQRYYEKLGIDPTCHI